MAKKTKKFVPSFEVELLPKDKAVAHKRLGPYDAPSAMQYGREWALEYGKLFSLNGFLFTWLTPTEIDGLVEDHGLIQFKNWAVKNYPGQGKSLSKPVGIFRLHNCYWWVRLPDGTWFVSGGSGRKWYTVAPENKKNGLLNDPKGVFQKGNAVVSTSFPKSSQALLAEFETTIEREFPYAWRESRNKYRQELFKSGVGAVLTEQENKQDHVQRTQIRMDVLSQTSKVQDLLGVFLKSVQDESMTIEDVSQIYHEVSKLTTLNKSLKKIYGAKMNKK